jgi:hemin uptake protein HemP
LFSRRLPIPETDPDPRLAEIDDVVTLVAPSHIVESLDLVGGEGDVVELYV